MGRRHSSEQGGTGPSSADSAEELPKVWRLHDRQFEQCRYVYPVVSRRSEGLSIGINLNPDRVCNFDCVYCQVDRRSQSDVRFVDTERLLAELEQILDEAVSGAIYEHERLVSTPRSLRRLNDIAFSGDGEPTTFVNFDEIVEAVADRRRRLASSDVRLILITNASMLHRPTVKRALEIFDRSNGQIWAKLDAGTAGYFAEVDRTPVPFQQILDNITQTARIRPVVIQSLFMNLGGTPPSSEEIDAWCDRLNDIQADGGQIEFVQVYSVARRPAESFVTPLDLPRLEQIAQQARERCSLSVRVYPGMAAAAS